MADATTTITKRLHISGITPNILATDLHSRLSNFGTVKSLDGFGLTNGVGEPRKFVYATLEGQPKDVSKCVNVLSGSTWKGAKLRLGDAKPDFSERIQKELLTASADAHALKKRRLSKYGGVQSEDMSLVTPDNMEGRAGWTATASGKILRRMRMRPGRPLPPTLEQIASDKKLVDGKSGKKKRKLRAPDSRARRKTIDVTRWGGERLSGVFLEGGMSTANFNTRRPEPEEEVLSSDDSEEDIEEVAANVVPPPKETVHRPVAVSPPTVQVVPIPTAPMTVDLNEEKNQTLGLLQSLFGANDWAVQDELDSDIEVEKDRVYEAAKGVDAGNDFEIVPMDVDEASPQDDVNSESTASRAPSPVPAPVPVVKRPSKLKDLFAPRADEGQFSLLGHLDLDLDLDEEIALAFQPSQQQQQQQQLDVPDEEMQSITVTATHHTATLTLDPRKPMFFPSYDASSRVKVGVKDLFHMDAFNGFYRTETDEEIRQRWENKKVELTRGWKKRCREAGKVRRRRGGGEDGPE